MYLIDTMNWKKNCSCLERTIYLSKYEKKRLYELFADSRILMQGTEIKSSYFEHSPKSRKYRLKT